MLSKALKEKKVGLQKKKKIFSKLILQKGQLYYLKCEFYGMVKTNNTEI